jgi:RHS repeat-associated protein
MRHRFTERMGKRRPPRLVSLGRAWLSAACACLLGAQALAAQGEDTTPPTFLGLANTTYTGPTTPQAPATFSACDNGVLTTSTLRVWLNGTDITSRYALRMGAGNPGCSGTQHSFAVYDRQTSSPLNHGANSLRVYVCDDFGNCADKTYTYTWADAVPTVSFSPNGGRFATPGVSVDVTFNDDNSLNLATHHMVLNGVDVTSSFTLYSNPLATTATYRGTLQLAASGSSTFQASISDNAGQSSGLISTTFSVGPVAPVLGFSAATRTSGLTTPVTIAAHEDDQVLQSASIWLNGAPYTTAIVVTQTSDYDVTYSSQMPLQLGDNVVKAKVCSVGGCATDSTRIFRYAADRATPSISLEPTNQDWRLPSPTEATQAYSTPAYFSRDQARSVTLTYASGLGNPIGFVQVDASDYSGTPPSQMSISLKDANGVTVTGINGAATNWYQAANGTARLGFRFWASSYGTGALSFTAVVRSYWPDGTYLESTAPVRIVNLNKMGSAYGAGWDIAGLQRVYQQGNRSLVVDNGDATAGYFAFVGCYDANGNPVGAGGTCKFTSPPGDFSTLVQYLDAGAYYTRTYLDGSSITYNGNGWMTQVSDLFGNTTQYLDYSQSGSFGPLLGTIIDPAGKVTNIMGSGGRLSVISGPDGRASVFSYSGATVAPDLTAVTGPDNVVALRPQYVSGPSHLLGGWTDRTGSTWTLAYDPHWELQSVTTPAVPLASGAAAQAMVTQVRSATAVVVPAGVTSQAAPGARVAPGDAWARLTTPAGDSVSVVFDPWGAAQRVRDYQGRVSLMLRNASGQDTLSVSATGDTVRSTWNGPELSKVTTADGVDNYTYNAAHQLVQEIAGTAAGRDLYYWYGPNGRVDSAAVSGTRTRYTYDAYGRIRTMTDTQGRVTRYGYEPGGLQNRDTVVAPNGALTRTTFNAYGLPLTVTDAKGRATTYAYDVLSRLKATYGPLADTTQVGYGAAFAASVTDAVHQAYGYSPNALGWDLQSTDPRGLSTRRTFNVAGSVTQVVNRRGQTVSTRYDAMGRVAAMYADGDSTTVTYDTAGTFQVVRNAVSVDTIRFDAAGRVASATASRSGRRYAVTFGYEAGKRSVEWAAELRVNDGTIPVGIITVGARYRWSRGLLQRVVLDDADSLVVAYNGDNSINSVQLPGRLRARYSYVTGFDRAVGISYANTDGTARPDLERAAGEQLNLDSLGLITSRTLGTQDSTYTYTYDAGNRLVQWAKTAVVSDVGGAHCSVVPLTGTWCEPQAPSAGQAHQLTWDRVGNTTLPGSSVGWGNRLMVYNGLNMEYDADGNTTRMYKLNADGTVRWDRQFQWNALGQLTRVCTNGACLGYLYDGLGRRVGRTDGAGNKVRQWVLDDAGQTVLELDGSGNVLAGYMYMPGIDQPVAMNRGGQRYLYLRDHQGSVMALVDSAGHIVNRYRYDPWGISESAVEGVVNPLQYNGRDNDTGTDLYYYRARWYSAGLGRFISEDPVGLEGGINPLAYVGNDPVNYSDPTGLCSQRKPFGGKIGMKHPDGSVSPLVEGYATCEQIRIWEQAELAEGTGSRFGRRPQMDEGPVPGTFKPTPQAEPAERPAPTPEQIEAQERKAYQVCYNDQLMGIMEEQPVPWDNIRNGAGSGYAQTESPYGAIGGMGNGFLLGQFKQVMNARIEATRRCIGLLTPRPPRATRSGPFWGLDSRNQ